ncbi:bacteriohemerythrin [Alkalitalea saponilacus]|uniref:Hemerythrin n=1 Tax=Alkalitalea saponilacus TaxID=889453 RepID=A0A1T5AL65_9BACT|nr:bacteriohemerythrin [Alkalitalea saponilacus]ASB48663.1 hemerythrin [Alkalitalea saponilacus]SKB35752.1 hemerythrin [Alkalitalea saponilacus]
MIKWNDNFSVNNQSIDQEHQSLFKALNDFYEGLSNKASNENMSRLIENLINYTKTHFANEEEFMLSINYPRIDEHIKEHREFITKTEDFYTKFKSGKLLVSFEVTNFIKDWITQHIMTEDQQYAAFAEKQI